MGKNYLKNSSSELEFSLYQQSIIFRLTFFDLLTEFFLFISVKTVKFRTVVFNMYNASERMCFKVSSL